jgi:hypothetical protein
MAGTLTVLNKNKLGNLEDYVIFFMGSVMVLDNKTSWGNRGNARRSMSILLSREYNSNPALSKTYKNVGEYRKSLEEKGFLKVCKGTELSVKINLR